MSQKLPTRLSSCIESYIEAALFDCDRRSCPILCSSSLIENSALLHRYLDHCLLFACRRAVIPFDHRHSLSLSPVTSYHTSTSRRGVGQLAVLTTADAFFKNHPDSISAVCAFTQTRVVLVGLRSTFMFDQVHPDFSGCSYLKVIHIIGSSLLPIKQTTHTETREIIILTAKHPLALTSR